MLVNQLRNPLLLVLVFAAAASALTAAWVDALIVIALVVATAGIGYFREYQAETAAAALQARVGTQTRVLREGHAATVPLEETVPGDIVLLAAGSLVRANGTEVAIAPGWSDVNRRYTVRSHRRKGAAASAAGNWMVGPPSSWS